MAAEYICDGCGKRALAEYRWDGWTKPRDWFQRTDSESGTILDACSRSCVDRVNQQRGETKAILPL